MSAHLKTAQYAFVVTAIALGLMAPAFSQSTPGQRWPGKGDYKSWDKAMKVFEEGNELLGKARYDEAITKFKSAIDIYPSDQNFFNNLGVAYYQKGDLKQAEDAYQQATQQDAKAYGSWNNLAESLRMQNKFDEARKAYQKALDTCPKMEDRSKIESNVVQLQRQMEARGASYASTAPAATQPH